MRACFLLLILITLIPRPSQAQSEPNFFEKHGSISIDYRVPINKNIINSSNNGISIEATFSLSKLWSDKDYFSIFGGWGWKDKLWKTSYTSEYAEDFDQALNLSAQTGLDSMGLASLQNDHHHLKSREVPLPSYHNGFHELTWYYGVVIGHPDIRFPILKAYTGITRTIGGTDRICETGGEYGYHVIHRPMTFGFNISLRDVIHTISQKHQGPLSLSIYYEQNNYSLARYKFWDGCEYSTEFNFSELLGSSFTDKYKNDVRFGFKLGVWIGYKN